MARRIKERGFVLSMDDFGTGYSSLSLLKDLPVDIIKLDKIFPEASERPEKIIIANVIHLAHELDIQVISEGIETAEHEAFLTEIGCNLAQGYRYGRPAPIEEYKDLTDE
ncbi:MAG: EAL domain-containing protein [Clostridium sp.]